MYWEGGKGGERMGWEVKVGEDMRGGGGSQAKKHGQITKAVHIHNTKV